MESKERDKKIYCGWSRDDKDSPQYETGCGHSFYFDDGDLDENHFKFCPFCGRGVRGDKND